MGLFELESSKGRVEAVLMTDQFVMGAAFDDGSARHDENLIAAANGGKPVGDDDGGAILHELIQRFLDEPFTLGVEATGCFIQNEDRGIC